MKQSRSLGQELVYHSIGSVKIDTQMQYESPTSCGWNLPAKIFVVSKQVKVIRSNIKEMCEGIQNLKNEWKPFL